MAERQQSLNDIANVYMAVREEWANREGSVISSREQWRKAFFAMSMVAVLAIGVAAWEAHTLANTPVRVVATQLACDGNTAQPRPYYDVTQELNDQNRRIVYAEIKRYISDLRTVTFDGQLMQAQIARGFGRSNNYVQGFLTEHYGDENSENNPVRVIKSGPVSVKVSNIMPVSKDTFQVDWDETKFDAISGAKTGTVSMRAMITVGFVDLKSVDEAQDNPLGVQFTSLAWSKL